MSVSKSVYLNCLFMCYAVWPVIPILPGTGIASGYQRDRREKPALHETKEELYLL